MNLFARDLQLCLEQIKLSVLAFVELTVESLQVLLSEVWLSFSGRLWN